MNWQTREIQDWLVEVGASKYTRRDISRLQEFVKSRLLIKDAIKVRNLGWSDYLRNLGVEEFLKQVQWEELVDKEGVS